MRRLMTQTLLAFVLLLALCAQAWAATFYVDKRTGNDAYTAAQAQNPATPWKTLRNPCLREVTGAGNHTIEIVAGSGPYYSTDMQSPFGYMYPTHLAGKVITWNFNRNEVHCDINVNTPFYKWRKSGSSGKTDWYYLTDADDSATTLVQVKSAVVRGYWSAETTNLTGIIVLYGHYATDNWAWGDFDSLGFSTLYVRYNGGESPTGKAPILVAQRSYIAMFDTGTAENIINNAIFQGGNIIIIKSLTPLTLNRCELRYSDAAGLSGLGSDKTYTINYCKFIGTGHRGVNVDGASTVSLKNCYFQDVHLALRIDSNSTYTVLMRNCATYNLLAGGIQKDVPLPTLIEDHNQWHIDHNSTHGGEAIAFTGGVRAWTTTAASDLPANTATSARPSETVDPKVKSDGSLRANSPCRNAGVAIPGLMTDFLGKPLRGLPDIGAYEYRGGIAAILQAIGVN